MNILIIGKGGREHAMAWKCAQNKNVNNIFVAPGNKGIENIASIVALAETDVDGLVLFAIDNKIDLTIVGPETSLEKGIADAFEQQGLKIFAPSKAASKIEWSKDFCKNIMQKYNIPTAAHETFFSEAKAWEYVQQKQAPFVIKEDGLKAGKGVTIAYTLQEAQTALSNAFKQKENSVVIEEFLKGFEYSLIALVHKNIVVPFDIAQDHKRVGDGDIGLNTGGMGAYSPVNKITPNIIQQTMQQVMQPMAEALCTEGIPFTGFLYGGLMLTPTGIKTIEFNARFGDPEAEVLLPRLQNDLVHAINDVMNGKKITLQFDPQYYVGVVLASTNYPQSDTKGVPIHKIENVNGLVFHMGTDKLNGVWTSNGGRVLCVVEKAETLAEAQKKVYHEVYKIESEALFFRTDIGAKNE